MTAINTVSRRAALATVVLSALAAANAEAKLDYKPKFTWWAILIMMIGIVVVISVALVIYFCVFRKPEEDMKNAAEDSASEGSAAVQSANGEDNAEHEPAHKNKDYPVE